MTRAEKLGVLENQKRRNTFTWFVLLITVGVVGYHFGGVWGLVGAVAFYCGIDVSLAYANIELIVKLEKMNDD